jgi:TM2 domain-containing membrane protein YozV
MSRALVHQRGGSTGILPAVASGFVPGLGQLLNGQADKALGVFLVAAVCGSAIKFIPVIGAIAALVGGVTWLYGVADAFLTARKK